MNHGGTVLVLAAAHDAGAWAVARAVARRVTERAEQATVTGVLPEQLACAVQWSHRVDTAGATTTIRLADGRQIRSEQVGAVLNRIEGVPPMWWSNWGDRDRQYAAAEFQALYVSWLHGLECRVVNPVDGDGGWGRRSQTTWWLLASRQGLPVAPWLAATSRRVAPVRPGERLVQVRDDDLEPGPELGRGYEMFGGVPVRLLPPAPAPGNAVVVVGERAFGRLASGFGDACVAVAAEAGCPLLAFAFSAGPDPVLVSVDPLPALAEQDVVQAVADLLVVATSRGAGP